MAHLVSCVPTLSNLCCWLTCSSSAKALRMPRLGEGSCSSQFLTVPPALRAPWFFFLSQSWIICAISSMVPHCKLRESCHWVLFIFVSPKALVQGLTHLWKEWVSGGSPEPYPLASAPSPRGRADRTSQRGRECLPCASGGSAVAPSPGQLLFKHGWYL